MAAIELEILKKLQQWLGSDFADRFFTTVTKLGDEGLIWILLVLVLIALPRTRKIGYVAAVSLILEAVVCNLILKPLIGRIRPCDLVPGLQLLIPRPEDYSFPSGHTSASFAVASALFFCKSRLAAPTFVLAVLIAFSRLYLHVHFPTDVLAGALIGIASGYAAWSCKWLRGDKQGGHL